MPAFTWLTQNMAIAALQGRLQNSTFWTSAECAIYLNEALRLWNALTEQWNSDFVFPASGWTNLGTAAGSPRLRSVTDTSLYTQMEYMLLEPPTGGTWTGTNQFNISSFSNTLQKRRDEVIQASGCNWVQLEPLPITPGGRRNLLPDTILEPHRARIIPLRSPVDYGPPLTMTREDTQAFQYFEPDYLQTFAIPQSWSVPSEPPLSFDVDNAPNFPGTYDMIGIQSGPAFAPPDDSLLGVPDDWSFIPMYGALADLLGSESERSDKSRADYCLKKFTFLLSAMKQSNWLVQGAINNIAVDTPALFEKDTYAPEWESDPNAWPSVVQAGMDFVYPVGQSAKLTLVGNAPLPQTGSDFVQVSRDVFDVILSYAQRLAMFKEAGEEFMSAQSLEDDFFRAAQETNKRLLNIGIFTDILKTEGQRENEVVPR